MIWVVASGLYNLGFGLFHLTFWRLLNWREQLKALSPTNRAVMQTLNLCLTLFFLLSAYLYLFYPTEIRGTGVGRAFALGMLVFWIARTLEQAFLFRLEQRVHRILLAVFVLGVFINGVAVWG
ncbi:MAG TPA: hypothetical protein VGL40_08950 [Bacillota bacterium]